MEVKKENPSPNRLALTKERLIEEIQRKNPPQILKLAQEIMAKLEEAGLTTRGFPSCIMYGVEIKWDFVSIAMFTATNIWFSIPKRAVQSLGPDQFKAFKKKINTLAKFYKPEELDDPTKTGGLGPRYTVLDGKLETFVDAVRSVADEIRSAVSGKSESDHLPTVT